MSKEEKIKRLLFMFDAFGEVVLDALNSETRNDVLVAWILRNKMN